MKTTPEMQFLNYCEIHGHAESARILRAIVEKQRTPHSDTDAHPENQGPDLSPLFSERWRNGTLKRMTAEEARYAYDKAIKPLLPMDVFCAFNSTNMAEEAPTQAVPCDSRRFDHWNHILDPKTGKWHYLGGVIKHNYILSDGTPRQEPCCK